MMMKLKVDLVLKKLVHLMTMSVWWLYQKEHPLRCQLLSQSSTNLNEEQLINLQTLHNQALLEPTSKFVYVC